MKNIKSVKTLGKMKIVVCSLLMLFTFTTLALAKGGGRYLSDDAWSFGLMADTQWTVAEDPEGANPETVSGALADVIQQEFIDYGVEFVIQVGDLSDLAGDAGMQARADVAQPLLDAGIGYFPLRGNHETYGFLFGRDPEHDMDIPAYLAAFPQVLGTANTFGATNISSPSDIMTGVDILDGLSYSFDYGAPGNNARFVIVDVEQTSYSELLPVAHPEYGDPYTYVFFTVYQVDFPVEGVTTTYDSAANAIEVDKPITIEPGTWFRIDSSGRPSTNMYAWDVQNPDQTVGYDYYYPYENWVVPQQPSWTGAGTEFWPGMQQDWISDRLDKTTRGTEHAFVLGHRGLMGTNHVDCFFGSNPGSKSSQQNPFYASLADNGVRYVLFGHDHLYNRSLVDSPDGENQVQQIIHMAASTKFYGPATLNSFTGAYGPVKQRETEISQELFNVGYYIYTIDGQRLLVDYYSDSEDGFEDNENYPYGPEDTDHPLLYLPELNFVKKDSYGYGTNGKQFVVPQGGSYTVVEDNSGRFTYAKILDGTNNSTTTDQTPTVIDDNGTPEDTSDDIINSAPRPLNKVVTTGWARGPFSSQVMSDVLSLWGMGELGTAKTDTYVLEMGLNLPIFTKYRAFTTGEPWMAIATICIATYVNGEWVNAVDENFGGRKQFVFGPYKPIYDLGTYGIDLRHMSAWAVINYNADFGMVKDAKGSEITGGYFK